MAYSMTGYGSAKGKQGNYECTVELRSVNQRFLDIKLKSPSEINYLEHSFREIIKTSCHRGKVECSIALSSETNEALAYQVAPAKARAFASISQILENEMGYQTQMRLSELITLGILSPVDTSGISKDTESMLHKTLKVALKEFNKNRKQEGDRLTKDIKQRFDRSAYILEEIETLAKARPSSYFEKLRKHLETVGSGIEYDENVVLRELAIFTDRCDITEEIIRFRSHIEHKDTLLQQEGSIGKKMDFLLQEFGREVNTIASKSGSAEISQHVIEIKSELERIREQVQNIE